MIMMGRESLNDLQKCRKVCKSWNEMMSQVTKYEKDNIRRKAESLAAQIREEWEDLEQRRKEWEDFEMIREEWEENEEPESKPFPPFPDIATTASLAHHGMFGSVELECMDLKDVDLASVHVEHLASLFSCVMVTYNVCIINVSNCNLVSILDSVKTECLVISKQRLSREETWALVRAMESHVDMVVLGLYGDVRVDMMALTQYNGQGKCQWVRCWHDTARKYREEVRSWARRINWTGQWDLDGNIMTINRSSISRPL